MANLIPEVARIEKAMRMGWPSGTSEIHREIPTLLDRIRELENALVPFARQALMEASTNPNLGLEDLTGVYLKHCHKALEKVDTKQGTQPIRDNFFDMPAG
jgi:hypothetical protein